MAKKDKTVQKPLDPEPGPEITKLEDLKKLASYHLCKPITKITTDDMTATANFVLSVRVLKIRKKIYTESKTRDEVIGDLLGEWAKTLKGSPHRDPNYVAPKEPKEPVEAGKPGKQ